MYRSIKETTKALESGQTTCVELTNFYLNNIEKHKHLNAFLEVFEVDAMNQAIAIDEKIKNGSAGKLAGVVVGIKDNLCYKGHQVSASSKILQGFTAVYHATVVDRLLAEDAIIIGRLNCDEFAMGSSNENSAFGNVLNPLDNERVPGGSSGGSAVAVAADLCLVALGTDTGGSIRQPASFCGVVGLKPSYGRVSRYGCIAYASSFDQIGPLAHNVEDCALVLDVIGGMDEYDSTMLQKNYAPINLNVSTEKKYKVAVLREAVESPGLDGEIKAHVQKLIDLLRANGHEVELVNFPFLDYVIPAYYVLTTAEASSNLSRYDGIHYGYRSPNATDLESTYKLSRSEGFGKEVQRRIMLGTFVLSSGYYDAYYSKAQKARRIIREATNKILSNYDFIMLPATPDVAFRFGENSSDPIKMYLEDIYTVQANLCGIPAISLPTGKNSQGLPFGMQFMAAQAQDEALLQFSYDLMNKL
ncbi:MAG: Asp-tRNA(Asn)/Glu-tRNA(Gln) amidotransferase subunit GatA [Flavobacteriales bacterium]